MRKLFVFFSLSVLVLGFTMGGDGGATVLRDGTVTNYGLASWDPVTGEGYSAFGAGDWGGIYEALNFFAGCSYEVEPPPHEELDRHRVWTPSGNFIGSINGPMIHAIWHLPYQDPCSDEPMTWGYGSYNGKGQWKVAKGFSLHLTASASLPDNPDMCQGDLIDYSGVLFQKEDGSIRNFHINLSCQEDE